MRGDISIRHDDAARHRAEYRRERDLVANATTEHVMGLLGADGKLTRTAAKDELLRREEQVSP